MEGKIIEALTNSEDKTIETVTEIDIQQITCSTAVFGKLLDVFSKLETEEFGLSGFSLTNVKGLDTELSDVAYNSFTERCQNLKRFKLG